MMARQRIYSEEFEKAVCAFIQANSHMDKYMIAQVFGTDPQWVWKVAHACGIKLATSPRLSSVKNGEYLKFIQEHGELSVNELADELGVNAPHIRSLVKKHSLQVRKERSYTRRETPVDDYTIKRGHTWLI